MCTFVISPSSSHIRSLLVYYGVLSESDSNNVKQVQVRPPATPLVVRRAKQPAVIARTSQPSQFALGSLHHLGLSYDAVRVMVSIEDHHHLAWP